MEKASMSIGVMLVLFIIFAICVFIYIGTKFWHFKTEYVSGYFVIYKKYGLFSRWKYVTTCYDEQEAENCVADMDRFLNADLYDKE